MLSYTPVHSYSGNRVGIEVEILTIGTQINNRCNKKNLIKNIEKCRFGGWAKPNEKWEIDLVDFGIQI